MSKFQIIDAADWVIKREVARLHSVNGQAPSDFALVDYQDRISNEGIERFCQLVERVNDESRLEDSSLLILDLNDQQRLSIHHIFIIRDGERLNALNHERIAVNERQRGLESHVVDGITTVSYSIEDLRVGDIIDYAYTIVTKSGGHPVYGQFYLATRWLTWNSPVKVQYVRLLNDSQQPVSWYVGRYDSQTFAAEKGVVASGEKYELALTDLPISRIDQSVPRWFWPDFIVLASTKDWRDVSREMATKYSEMGIWDESLDLTGVVSLENTEPEDAIILLLRFVQNEVRYKSESSGIFSHTPKIASRTLTSRHGDCKDKATLLKLLLAQIGVSADLVLVSTELENKISDLPPSPLWFDHMILRIRHDGKEYFVDPTIKKQGGNLQHMADLPYPLALPLCEEGCELISLPRNVQDLVFDLTHTIDFSRENSDHYYLGIRRVFYGHRADNIRYYLSSKTTDLLADEFLNYARDDLSIKLDAEIPIHVERDDQEKNRLETYEQYYISGLGDDDDNRHLEIRTDHVGNFPTTNSFDYPLMHNLDGKVLHKIDVLYRDYGPAVDESKQIRNDWFSYRDEVKSSKKACHFRTETVPVRSLVSAKDLKAYMDDVEAIRQRSINRFPFKTHNVEWMDSMGSKMVFFAFMLLLIMALANRG